MLDSEDLKWIAANAEELNRLLQQAAHTSEQALLHKEERYFDMLHSKVGLASQTSQAICDRVNSCLLEPPPKVMAKAPSPAEVLAPVGVSSDWQSSSAGEVFLSEEASNPPVIRNPNGTRELILVVDDDSGVLQWTGEILEFEDYRVIMANDGFEAIRIYRQLGEKISLILLDYFLPVMDGDVIFDELQAIDPRVRVVLSSGFGEHAKIGTMLGRGLCGFIPKPYSHQKLIEQIRSILDA